MLGCWDKPEGGVGSVEDDNRFSPGGSLLPLIMTYWHSHTQHCNT